jgi:hypothetical protein
MRDAREVKEQRDREKENVAKRSQGKQASAHVKPLRGLKGDKEDKSFSRTKMMTADVTSDLRRLNDKRLPAKKDQYAALRVVTSTSTRSNTSASVKPKFK